VQSLDLGDHLFLISFMVNPINLVVISGEGGTSSTPQCNDITLNSGRTFWTGLLTNTTFDSQHKLRLRIQRIQRRHGLSTASLFGLAEYMLDLAEWVHGEVRFPFLGFSCHRKNLNGFSKDAEQTCGMGKRMDKRIPLFQCGHWLLDRWGA